MDAVMVRSPRGSDVAAMSDVCAAVGTIARHDAYLFWLFATLYSERSLVATVDDKVCAYLLSAPLPVHGAEFIVQVAVAPNLQRRRVGLLLLEQHRSLLRRARISTVMTSITVGCRPGEALMQRAIAAGFSYRPIPWPPIHSDPVPSIGADEVLFEAEV